jgi:anti-sigma-K factor RskA
MFARRIVACACALAVAVPAAASARPGFDPPVASPAVAGTGGVTYGDTKSDLQNKQDLGAPSLKGDTKADVAPPAGNSVEAITSLSDEQLAAAYGTTKIDARPVATPRAAVASTDDGTNGWRIAAVAEAGLLAAIALGAAALVARARPRRGAAA